MKKIVIFGATGNVGSYVLKYAREYFDPAEYEVIASGRRKTDFFANGAFHTIPWIFPGLRIFLFCRRKMCMQ